MRILIANRGEIARRIQRSASRTGHETIAVFADPDADAPFVREASTAVRLGPADLASSYLSIDRLLAAARRTGATALHPGYGFLSENAALAQAVIEAGLTWIGPAPKTIERMGNKIEARAVAESVGVPTIPGFSESQQDQRLQAAAKEIGLPVLVKAAAGGGGKGIRVVAAIDDLPRELAAARAEAQRSFASGDVIVERLVAPARHVEVQVVGDRQGGVIELGTRECSVQRRYQKLFEEAPAPNLSERTERGLREAARRLAQAIDYDSVGTVEFVVDDATGDFYFLEMNTRLQVEHPVTEEVTGLDLVALQIRCAEGRPLGLDQSDVLLRGHAIEVRINAEDAARDFAPRTGLVTALAIPPGVRWESAVEPGSAVTPHYDSMLAKLIVHDETREGALDRLAAALDALILSGVPTNAGFHRWLVDLPEVRAGRAATSLLADRTYPDGVASRECVEVAAAAWRERSRAETAAGPWQALAGFRLTPERARRFVTLRDRRGEHFVVDATRDLAGTAVAPGSGAEAVPGPSRLLVDLERRRVSLNVRGETHSFEVATRSEGWAPSVRHEGGAEIETARAPFPGVVSEIAVRAGDEVATGDAIVVIEAMKMLHVLSAHGHGVVRAVHVEAGESVDSGQVLVSFRAPGSEVAASAGEQEE